MGGACLYQAVCGLDLGRYLVDGAGGRAGDQRPPLPHASQYRIEHIGGKGQIIMARFILPFVIFMIVAIFLFVGLGLNPHEVPSPLVGKPAPAFSLPQLGNPYTLVVSDAEGRVGIDYGVYGVPETYLIDKQGVIQYKHIGVVTEKDLSEKILPLVKELQAK